MGNDPPANVHVTRQAPDFWDDFVEHHQGLLFHRSDWADVLAKGYGYQPCYCWYEQDGAPRLGFMGGIVDFRIVRVLNACIPYGGLLGDESYLEPFCRQLGPALQREGIHQLQLAEPGTRPRLETFGFQGVVVARHQADIADYADAEALRAALPRSVRKNLNRAEREGLVVEPLQDRSDVDVVFDLYLKTMERNRAAAKYPHGRFAAIFDQLAPKELGVILVARKDGAIIGANTLVCSDETVHDIQLSYDHNYQALRPTDALVFASFLWAIERHKRYFDFMGSPANDESLEKFKTKWLAERSTTVTYIKTYAALRSACWTLAKRLANSPLGAHLTRMIRKT